jgi:hypothetical protein
MHLVIEDDPCDVGGLAGIGSVSLEKLRGLAQIF